MRAEEKRTSRVARIIAAKSSARAAAEISAH